MTAGNALQLFLLGLLTLVMGIPAILVGLLLPGKVRKGKLFRLVSKSYSRVALYLFGIRLKVLGRDRVALSDSYVFMSNHVSHADSPALAVAIPHPLHWVFKRELAKVPVFGWVLLAAGQIMVNRSDLRQSKAALEQAFAELSGNSSVMIYPEGTRSRDGRLQPFKKGGFLLAVAAGLPIVPVRVSGTRDIVAAGSLSVRPGEVVVELFAPVPTVGKTDEDVPELMARVREAILSGTPGPA